jgi:hypothetical protein
MPILFEGRPRVERRLSVHGALVALIGVIVQRVSYESLVRLVRGLGIGKATAEDGPMRAHELVGEVEPATGAAIRVPYALALGTRRQPVSERGARVTQRAGLDRDLTSRSPTHNLALIKPRA